MKYLSIDIEATGLDENDYIIEWGMAPFDTSTKTIANNLKAHLYVKCPSFEEIRPNLNPWVIEHNKDLIIKAHEHGKTILEFKTFLTNYLESDAIKTYFENQKIVLFGKSMNAIDLPFLNRDLGWNFMRKYFSHRVLDLTSHVYGLIDLNFLPKKCESGSELMKFLNMGDVAHTALEDAINTAQMYIELINRFKRS